MTTLNLRKYADAGIVHIVAIVLIWWLIKHFSMTIVDPSIIQVILVGFAAWLTLLQLALLICNKLLKKIFLQLQDIFNPYKRLTSWQQHVLYLAFYVLLVLSGTGCLIAIC